MNLLKILTVASAAAWLYTSTANAQNDTNPLDRDLSTLVSDGQQLVQELQRDMEGMAASEGRQSGSSINSLLVPQTAERTAKNIVRERKEAYVEGICQTIGLASSLVVDENGRPLPMDATYQHSDGTVSLIGIATLEGIDETMAKNCPRIVGKGYDTFHSPSSERVLSSVANLHDSLGTQASPLIAYAAKELSDAIKEAYSALSSDSAFTNKDRELVQSNYFQGIEQKLLGIQGQELPERLRVYAEMYQQGVQEGSVILQNLGLLGLEGNSYALTVPTVEFSAGRFWESEKPLRQEEGHFNGVRFVEEVLIPYVQQVYVDSMTQQQEHGTRRQD